MATHTLSQAARLCNVSRNTLYRAIREGRLTRLPDSTIDTSELLRAGFEVQQRNVQVEHGVNTVERSVSTDKDRLIEHLERELETSKAREHDLRRLVDQEKEEKSRIMALLEIGKRPGLRDRLRRFWRGTE